MLFFVFGIIDKCLYVSIRKLGHSKRQIPMTIFRRRGLWIMMVFCSIVLCCHTEEVPTGSHSFLYQGEECPTDSTDEHGLYYHTDDTERVFLRFHRLARIILCGVRSIHGVSQIGRGGELGAEWFVGDVSRRRGRLYIIYIPLGKFIPFYI